MTLAIHTRVSQALNIVSFEPRRFIAWRGYAYVAAGVVTAGLVPLVGSWDWFRAPLARILSAPSTASACDAVVVTHCDGSAEVCVVEEVAEQPLEVLPRSERMERLADFRRRAAAGATTDKMIVFRHTRFIWSPTARNFLLLDPEVEPEQAGTVPPHKALNGLSYGRAEALHRRFGSNLVAVPVPPALELLLRECTHPFLAFQVWAVVIWLIEAYYVFSAFIFVCALVSALANFWEVRRNLVATAALARFAAPVTVLRRHVERDEIEGGASEVVQRQPLTGHASAQIVVMSDALVPGDIIEIVPGMKLPCDAVLLSGGAAVNEAMLTGESTVVIKAPLPGAALAVNAAEARNTLFGGSVVTTTRASPGGGAALAIVVRTGFDTVKGRLVLSIRHPKPAHFNFMKQSYIFIGVLFIVALMGFAVNARAMQDCAFDGGKIALRCVSMCSNRR